jgi:N4-gp56 family major capsid protein
MAFTAFGALSALQKRVWLDQVAVQGRHRSFWLSNGFVSTDENNTGLPVTKVTKLNETERGTEAVMPLVPDLDINSGVVNDNELEGNEAVLGADSQTIRIDQLRNAVKSKGRMAEQETVIRFRAQAQDKLAFWLADVKDELMFLTVAGRAYTLTTDGATRAASQLPDLKFAADVAAASTNRIIYGGAANSEASLTASDTMTWNLVVKAAAFAKRKAIQPIRQAGREYYCIVMSTEQMRDLVQSADYKAIVAQAEARGSQNPLFANAKAVIQGVVLYEHQKVYHTLGGTAWGAGNSVHGAQAALIGAQALGMCELRGKAAMAESDNKDYDNRVGIGISNIFGLLKPQYKSKYDANAVEDAAVVSIKTAAAA